MSKQAYRYVRKIITGLENDMIKYEKENEPDMEDLCCEDAKDYEKIAMYLEINEKDEATRRYDNLDTAAREYLWDYLSDDEASYMNRFFGWA